MLTTSSREVHVSETRGKLCEYGLLWHWKLSVRQIRYMCPFGIHPALVLRPTCFPEKVGIILNSVSGRWFSHQKWRSRLLKCSQPKGCQTKKVIAQINKWCKFVKVVNTKGRAKKQAQDKDRYTDCRFFLHLCAAITPSLGMSAINYGDKTFG